ncbi:hypothetical protein [Chryseobacterium aquaticum]|uniref:hypothetical protein n=1 Tax=Chryseobacterium aquaticum TaxID=452084 RepID=UPI002FCC1CD6
MKKISISIFFIIFASVSAQANFSLANNGGFLPQDNTILNKVNSPNAGKNLSYSDIQGTPYFTKGFNVAKFSGTHETAPARYNSYNDEVEFMKDEKTFVLPKDDKFSTIFFTNTKDKLVRLNTDDDLSGYFFEILDTNNFGLYKKVKTKFIDAVVAANSYATDRPASFKTLDPIFYIKTENGFIKNPKNQKEIISYFPEKKESLNIFFKENKTKFDKEEDLKKLVIFLNKD